MAGTCQRPPLRLEWLDRLRGLAIALMVLDHVLAVTDTSAELYLRLTVTRFALPLFMICAAHVWRPLSGRNARRLGLAAIAEVALCEALDFASPGIIAIYLGLMLGLRIAPRLAERPGVLLLFGLIQAAYVPLGWGGYEPGLVLTWWALGRLAAQELEAAGQWLPTWAATLGRHPLGWYVGHLAVLAAAGSL